MFGWCISHADGSFSFTDLTATGSANNGTFTPDATFPNLLTLTASSNSGSAVEMPGTQLLVNPGSLLTNATGSTDPVAPVFQQSGFCPSSGNNYRFVTTPKHDWVATQRAYGTVNLSSSSLTISSFDLNGKAMSSEVDSYTCDSTNSLLTVTTTKGNIFVAVSLQGLFQAAAGNGAAGILQALSNVGGTIAAGTFLGVVYQPNTANAPKTVGFGPGSCGASLCGFDPLTAGQPSNGITLALGAESSFGLFTSGTFVDTNTDSPFVMVAGTVVVNGTNKIVLYGVGFDNVANTPVAVLLLEQ
jgi:hypothetical protein